MFHEQIQTNTLSLELSNFLLRASFGLIGGATGFGFTYFFLRKLEIVDERNARLASLMVGSFCAYYCTASAPHF